jgi:3-hydroxyisobutyrate dehydrogenase-like beta-hydroxyacid dehydrogenase
VTNSVRGQVKTVGYIGLGSAGFSMSSNLPKNGYNLVVHDQDPDNVNKAVAKWKSTSSATSSSGTPVPEAFKDCEVVITMLPHGGIVREVLFGEFGIASSLKPGTIIVETSSSSPFDTQALGRELAQHNLHLIDSPITQTYMHATDDGKSTLMVGSDSQEHFEIVKPILECMASYIFHMGPLGAGHAMKTLNNYIMASSICALSDSLVTGQKFGLDPQKMIDVLNVGTGVNFPTMDTFRRDALTRNFNSGFGLALLVKDLGITQDFMEHSRFETRLPGLLREYLSHSMDVIGPERANVADHTECIRGWEERTGGGLTIKKTENVRDIPAEDFKHRRSGLNRK